MLHEVLKSITEQYKKQFVVQNLKLKRKCYDAKYAKNIFFTL